MFLFLVLAFLTWVAKTSSFSYGQFLKSVPKVSILFLLRLFLIRGPTLYYCCRYARPDYEYVLQFAKMRVS